MQEMGDFEDEAEIEESRKESAVERVGLVVELVSLEKFAVVLREDDVFVRVSGSVHYLEFESRFSNSNSQLNKPFLFVSFPIRSLTRSSPTKRSTSSSSSHLPRQLVSTGLPSRGESIPSPTRRSSRVSRLLFRRPRLWRTSRVSRSSSLSSPTARLFLLLSERGRTDRRCPPWTRASRR